MTVVSVSGSCIGQSGANALTKAVDASGTGPVRGSARRASVGYRRRGTVDHRHHDDPADDGRTSSGPDHNLAGQTIVTATATATATASRGDACDRLRRYRFRAHPPGSVTLPFQPGQHVWSAVSNGITLTLGMEPAAPHAGEPITFTMTATAPSTLPCWALYLEPSSTNGTAWQPIPTTGDACTGQALPTAAEHVLVQTYNRAGRLDFVFGANNLCVSSTSDVMAAMYSSFELGPGPSTAQGPLLPVLQVGDGRLPDQLHDPSLAAAYAHATDADGHLARFTVDWGDGTPVETYPGDQSPCIESSQGWPGSSTALMTSGLVYAAPTHRYSNPRPVAITVTVVSTGCDGTDPQQVTGTFPWVPPTP